jgi:hypothetical protein
MDKQEIIDIYLEADEDFKDLLDALLEEPQSQS